MGIVKEYQQRTYNEEIVLLQSDKFNGKASFNNSYLGLEGLCDMISVDLKKGLRGNDYEERKNWFGSNEMAPLEAEGFWIKFWNTLQDFMLKVLIVSGCFSIIVDMIVSSPSDRKLGK